MSGTTQRPIAVVAELVGPAGAGKSAVLRQLTTGGEVVAAARRPPVMRYLEAGMQRAPTLLRWQRPGEHVPVKAMQRVVYVDALARELARRRGRESRPIVFDEGPVYMCARLRYFDATRLGGSAFRAWWADAMAYWAEVLDLVVWLDAPTALLAERIRRRPGRPPTRDLSDEGVARFAERYRTCYQRVLADLRAAGGPEALRIDTADVPIEEAAGMVRARLEEVSSCVAIG